MPTLLALCLAVLQPGGLVLLSTPSVQLLSRERENSVGGDVSGGDVFFFVCCALDQWVVLVREMGVLADVQLFFGPGYNMFDPCFPSVRCHVLPPSRVEVDHNPVLGTCRVFHTMLRIYPPLYVSPPWRSARCMFGASVDLHSKRLSFSTFMFGAHA